nr:unnamed protein product [Callosobruchus analis]
MVRTVPSYLNAVPMLTPSLLS